MATRPHSSRLPAILFALALLSTAPILWRTVLPMLDGTNWPHHRVHLPILLTHAWGGLAMLAMGSAALYIGWTKRYFARHRWFGYAYLGLGGVGAIAALILSFSAPHEPKSLYLATGTLAATWLAFAAMALRAALNRRFESHRQWMIRSYVLSWTFVGCRLATMIDFYPWLGAESVTAAIWINWVVPILVCEIALQWGQGARVNRPEA